jgi:hypothetical protein
MPLGISSNNLSSASSDINRSSYRADVGNVQYRVRDWRGRDPVIMGLSCMDDYSRALNPITLRDGELHSAAERGCGEGGGAFRTSESSSTSLTHSHTHPFYTGRVPSPPQHL